MLKWEYYVLVSPRIKTQTTRTMLGFGIASDVGDFGRWVHEQTRLLGTEGWELVSTTPFIDWVGRAPRTAYVVLIFKRPIEEG